MRLLIITTPFFPDADANSHCVQNLLPALSAQGHTVEVLACAPERIKETHWEGYRVHSAVCPSLMPLRQARQRYGAFQLCRNIVHKLDNHVRMAFKPQYRRQEVIVEAYRVLCKALKRLNAPAHYDAIIATFFPLEAAMAAERVGGIPWYIYQLDAYIDNFTLPKEWKQDREQLQTRLFSAANGSFTTPVLLKDQWMQPYAESGKAIAVEFPCVVESGACKPYQQWETRHTTHCAYVGTLYPVLRSPEYLVSLMARMGCGDIGLYFFGLRQELVLQAGDYTQAKDSIVCRGVVGMEDAAGVLASADFLINIDNKASNQVPSKIFDYMSTGKPIINLYYNEDSAALEYFRRYPLSLNLLMDEERLDDNAAQMNAFIRKHQGEQMTFADVHALLESCTPEYVAGQMLQMIEPTDARRGEG